MTDERARDQPAGRGRRGARADAGLPQAPAAVGSGPRHARAAGGRRAGRRRPLPAGHRTPAPAVGPDAAGRGGVPGTGGEYRGRPGTGTGYGAAMARRGFVHRPVPRCRRPAARRPAPAAPGRAIPGTPFAVGYLAVPPRLSGVAVGSPWSRGIASILISFCVVCFGARRRARPVGVPGWRARSRCSPASRAPARCRARLTARAADPALPGRPPAIRAGRGLAISRPELRRRRAW